MWLMKSFVPFHPRWESSGLQRHYTWADISKWVWQSWWHSSRNQMLLKHTRSEEGKENNEFSNELFKVLFLRCCLIWSRFVVAIFPLASHYDDTAFPKLQRVSRLRKRTNNKTNMKTNGTRDTVSLHSRFVYTENDNDLYLFTREGRNKNALFVLCLLTLSIYFLAEKLLPYSCRVLRKTPWWTQVQERDFPKRKTCSTMKNRYENKDWRNAFFPLAGTDEVSSRLPVLATVN